MRLDDFLEDFEADDAAERRRLAKEKSYEITNYLEDVETRFAQEIGDKSAFSSRSPEIFVGRYGYPNVATGILSPVGFEDRAHEYRTDSQWYDQRLEIEDIVRRRTALLNARETVDVNVGDQWEGTIGVQREVAIADRPVSVDVDLADDITYTVESTGERVPPIGPRVGTRSLALAENPHVPKVVEHTVSDDDWQATGAITYLYRRGFDVYDINSIFSAGALGEATNRRLVPTRWSITAVDDTVGKYLRTQIRNSPSVDQTTIYRNEFLGNRYWIILTPGQWEYELVEMKGPGSVWNPNQSSFWLASAYEGATGRRSYVEETAGAYYAARLAVLEYLTERNRQAKVLVLREVTDDYWAPVGVWQVREGVRNAFDDEREALVAASLTDAFAQLAHVLPLEKERIRAKSVLLQSRQSTFERFTSETP